MADWMQARLRIAAHIDELRTWLIDGFTDDDDVRLVVAMLSQAQQRLRALDALLSVATLAHCIPTCTSRTVGTG